MLEHSLERLKKKLICQGLPVGHACRIVTELTAHAEDIEEELSESGCPSDEIEVRVQDRLGDFDLLAEQINESFARRTFWGRHPVITFALLPVLSFLLLIFVPILAGHLLVFALDIMKKFGVNYDLDATMALCRKSFDCYQHIFAVASATWFVCILRRYVFSMKWSALAAGILAILQYLLVSTLSVTPPVEAGKYLSGSFSVGLGFGLEGPAIIDRFVRFCMPVALFTLTYGRNIWHGYIRTSAVRR